MQPLEVCTESKRTHCRASRMTTAKLLTDSPGLLIDLMVCVRIALVLCGDKDSYALDTSVRQRRTSLSSSLRPTYNEAAGQY